VLITDKVLAEFLSDGMSIQVWSRQAIARHAYWIKATYQKFYIDIRTSRRKKHGNKKK